MAYEARLHVIRKNVKRKIKKGARESDMVKLYIPKTLEAKPDASFTRIHSREFRYKGQMYDIVKQTDLGDTTLYWCIWDKEETALFAQLGSLFDKAKKHDPKLLNLMDGLFKFYNQIWPSEHTPALHALIVNEPHIVQSYYPGAIHQDFSTHWAPPPNV